MNEINMSNPGALVLFCLVVVRMALLTVPAAIAIYAAVDILKMTVHWIHRKAHGG